jgi:hypothetical protein
VHAERDAASKGIVIPERGRGSRQRALSTLALVLGVVLMMVALYANAVARTDGDDPSAWLYALGGFGLLLVLSAILDAIEALNDRR